MSSIVAEPTITLPAPRKARTLPVEYNVLRRLYAAIILQAVYDLNNASTNSWDRLTAKWFLRREASFIADEFELDEDRILQYVEERNGWY